MADLFSSRLKNQSPLADRMRPTEFDDFFGQEELVKPEGPLRRAVAEGRIGSLILWGPPGSGKTTLAYLISRETGDFFEEFSAVSTGINDVRKAIHRAEERIKLDSIGTIVFIDEIHRFNKAQQDALLPWVERGVISLIGATTENPSFEVIAPLLSRSTVYVLESLGPENLGKIIKRALQDKEKGLGRLGLRLEKGALDYLISFADGDARAALNGLEFIAHYYHGLGRRSVGKDDAKKALQQHALRYDKKGEEHYNSISAFIKCLRASDVDAALYWLARMVESGEDPKFIARRMIIFASEDIGNADPRAVQLAVAIGQAVDLIGLPEAQINLAHGVAYLARAPKSRASYEALMRAKEDAARGSFGVPMHLRNPVTELMKEVGYGQRKNGEKTNFPEEIGPQKYYAE